SAMTCRPGARRGGSSRETQGRGVTAVSAACGAALITGARTGWHSRKTARLQDVIAVAALAIRRSSGLDRSCLCAITHFASWTRQRAPVARGHLRPTLRLELL